VLEPLVYIHTYIHTYSTYIFFLLGDGEGGGERLPKPMYTAH
jgi:hypothetical protein